MGRAEGKVLWAGTGSFHECTFLFSFSFFLSLFFCYGCVANCIVIHRGVIKALWRCADQMGDDDTSGQLCCGGLFFIYLMFFFFFLKASLYRLMRHLSNQFS